MGTRGVSLLPQADKTAMIASAQPIKIGRFRLKRPNEWVRRDHRSGDVSEVPGMSLIVFVGYQNDFRVLITLEQLCERYRE